MRIITISRQFSSGGRELGKRLADILGWDYYDKEIIERLSQEQGLDSDYVSGILTTHQWNTVPLTFQTTFTDPIFSPDTETNLLIRQIDKGRSQIRELLTGLPWGDSSAFDLTVNSSGWQIKALAPAVADFALKWFER